MLAVGTEGQDARPDMNEREFFFTKIIWAMDYTHMKSLRLAAEDFPLALATAKILPWPWGESSYRSALADIGEHEKPRGSHRMMPSTGVKITTIIS